MAPTFRPNFSMIQQETDSYNYNPSLWYPAGYPQPGPVNPQPGYGITEQEEQIMYQQYNQQVAQGPYYPSHNYSHIDNPQYFNYDYVYPGNNGIPPIQYQHQHPGGPTPPVTVSGSECSPDGLNININPSQFEPQLMNNPEPVAQQSYDWTQNENCNTEPKPGKTRTKDKYRSVYSDYQRMELERYFQFVNKFIDNAKTHELAEASKLTPRQVKIWFQNRRAKERNQEKKRLEELKQQHIFDQIQASVQEFMQSSS